METDRKRHAPANILLIHSDQHRYDSVGVHGHPLVQTPMLDRLAEEGMRFDHAFTPCPLCVPERNSLLCGQWPAEHMSIANHDTEASRNIRPGTPIWPPLLREAGYRTGYVGKWHVDAWNRPEAYGFDDVVMEGEYYQWRVAEGFPPYPHGNFFGAPVDPAVGPEQTRAGWCATRTIELLERYAGRGEPFFLRWDPVEPHIPNYPPEPFASLYPPETIPPWPGFADPLEGKPFAQAQQRRTWGIDGWGWEDFAPIVSRYLSDISLLDAQIGRVLEALDRLGLGEETLVIYTSDHGDMAGSHGMMDKHFVMYDDVVRVPLLARWPGRIPAGRVCDAFVIQAVDLANTFCDVAGVPAPETFRGESLLPALEGGSGPAREDAFSSYHGNQFGLYSQRMVRDRRWKYVWNATAEDELYDLETDPGEIRNRATDPACAEQMERLRGRLVAWMEETGDRLLNGWTRAAIHGRAIGRTR